MKKKLLIPVLALMIVPMATAVITDLDIVNVYPDSENRFRDTTAVARLAASSTTTTNVSLFITRPDGTQFQTMKEPEVTVKNGEPREVALTIQDENVTQYGNYMLTMNESTGAANSTQGLEVTPQPQTLIEIGDTLYLDKNFVAVNVNPIVGESLKSNEIENASIEFLRIDDDNSTTQMVEKTSERVADLAFSNTTKDLEANIDMSGFPVGQYEVNVRYNITSCGSCEKFNEVESTVVRLETDAMTNTAAIIGLAVLPFLVLLIVREFKKADNMVDEALLTLSLLFVIGLEYTGHGIASKNQLSNASDAYVVALLVTVLVFILVLIQLVMGYWQKTKEEDEFGYFGD